MSALDQTGSRIVGFLESFIICFSSRRGSCSFRFALSLSVCRSLSLVLPTGLVAGPRSRAASRSRRISRLWAKDPLAARAARQSRPRCVCCCGCETARRAPRHILRAHTPRDGHLFAGTVRRRFSVAQCPAVRARQLPFFSNSLHSPVIIIQPPLGRRGVGRLFTAPPPSSSARSI